MNEQLSFEEAKRLSIIKWEALVKNKGKMSFELLDSIPEIVVLPVHCGFCARWKNPVSTAWTKYFCNNCEFGKIAGICYNENSLYWKFDNDGQPALKQAKQILKLIKSLKENS